MKKLAIIIFILIPVLAKGQDSLTSLKRYDTIFVSNPNRNVKITFDKFDDPPVVDIGTKDFAVRILGCCDVILKAAIVGGKPTSLYIRYGDKYYNGTIAYKENLSLDDEVLDFRNRKDLPTPINENRAITSNSPSIEKQFADRRIGVLEGKSKDRFSRIATVGEKLIFKLADIMQDETYLYVKLGVYNESKEVYNIADVDFIYKNGDDSRDYKQIQDSDEISNGILSVAPKSSANLVVAFPKFALTSKWELKVNLKQKDGSRNISLSIPYKEIVEATKF